MKRRSVFAALLSLLPFGRVSKAQSNPRRWHVPPTLWYENQNGERWYPDREGGPPDEFVYQHSQFPRDLHFSICSVNGPRIASGTSSWPEDLVLAMTRDYRLSEAILIAANMCGRCMNAAGHFYGLPWGYAEGSPQWRASNTECEFCKGGR